LQHPHIVSIFALRHVEPHFFIVMEYVEGMNLADYIKRHGAIAWQDALPIIEQTLRAIDYAHREHIIHRDVKPHNILISRAGVAKITDFGLAKIQAIHSDTKALTRTGFTGGTLYYMPPEQLEGLLHVDHRGDIYGLGMTYYEMLAGRTPFDKLSSEFTILKAIDAHDFPSLDQFNAALPEPLVRIVMKAIEREPDDRYQSASDMLREIEAWQADSQPDAPGEGRPAIAPPSPPEAPAAPHVLSSLKAALAKGTQRFFKKESDSIAKTVLQKAPLKAKAPPKAKTPTRAKTPPKVSSKALPETSPKLPPRPPVSPPSPPPKPPSGEKKGREPEPPKSVPVAPEQKKERDPEPPKSVPVAPEQKKERDPEPPKSVPVAPSPQPTSSPEPVPVPLMRRRSFLVIGGVGVFVLLAFLLYFGTQRLFQPAALTADSTATRQTVLFSLRTLPDTAMIFIEGLQVGSTPLIDYEISAGTTALRIEKPGYIPLDTSITLGINQDSTFTFSLLEEVVEIEATPAVRQPRVGALTINSEPSGADVLLDGQNVGQTPLRLPGLEIRAYELVFQKQGFQDYSESITVAPGNDNQMTATLTAIVTATLQITVIPLGDIYVDGILKAQGTREPYTEAFVVGVYRVRVQHPQFGAWARQVTIDSSDPQDIVFDFNQTFAVSVTSEPNKAEILVDGQLVDERTPAVIRVRAGQRTIAVQRKGYLMEGAARRLTLERDWTDEPLHFPLRAIQ